MADLAEPLSADAFDALPEACAQVAADGKIRRANSAFVRLLGAGEPVEGLAMERFYADPLDLHLSAWNRPGAGRSAQSARLCALDGTQFPAEIKAAPLPAGVGTIVLVRRDSSAEAKAGEPALLEGTYSFDFASGRGILCDRLERFATGTASSGQIEAESWLGLFEPDARRDMFEALKAGPDHPHHLHRFTCRMRGADGTWRVFDHQLRVLRRGRRGQPLRLSGVARERPGPERHGGETGRLSLALEAGELCGWEYDFEADLGVCEGAVSARPSREQAGTFTLEDWRARLHPDDARRASAAFLGLQFGGTMDETYRIGDAKGGWHVHHTRAERDRRSGRAYGYTRMAGTGDARRIEDPEDIEILNSETARSVRSAALTTWTRDVETGLLTVRGPLTERFGLAGQTLQVPMKAWIERIHPEDRVEFDLEKQSHVRAIAGGETEYRILDSDNRYVRLKVRGGVSEQAADGRALTLSGVLIEIDETVTLRRQLAEAEIRLQEAVSAACLCAWQYDFRRETFSMSGALLDTLGLSPPDEEGAVEISMEAWLARLHRDDLARFGEAMEEARHVPVVELEYRLRDGEGAYRWLNVRGGITERDEHGTPLRSSGFFTDVTERRRLESELTTRERQLADAVEAGLVGIWTIDHITGAHAARGEVLRWMDRELDEHEVTATDWWALIHPDDVEAAREAFRRLNEGELIAKFDLRLRSPQGWRWVRTEGRPLAFDENRRALRSAGVIIDVSAERAYAAALAHEKERIARIYRRSPALMHTIDPQGRTLTVNDHWVARMGYLPEEILGRPGVSVIHEADRGRVADCLIPRAFETGELRREPVRLVTKSGEVLETRLSAFIEHDPDGRAVAAHGVFEDVTDLNRAQRELEVHAEELERTNRELNRFATVASHDLQEPLRKIAAFSSLLRRRYEGRFDPEADRCLDFLIDAAGRMRTLIEDLLAYSRASSRPLDTARVDLDGVLDEVLAQLELGIEETGAQIVRSPLPEIEGDRLLLSLLFQNLVSNAIKYRGEAAPRIEIDAREADGVWTLCVADNGIGVEEKFFDKIFAPFQRLHGREEYEGTGIGLAVCQQAVERHGGRIWIESEPGRGSRFYFTLPAEAGQDEAA